jgi:hypothetical protein
VGSASFTIWADQVHRLALQCADDQFELVLYEGDDVIRSERCADEHDARNKAHDWLIAREANPPEAIPARKKR